MFTTAGTNSGTVCAVHICTETGAWSTSQQQIYCFSHRKKPPSQIYEAMSESFRKFRGMRGCFRNGGPRRSFDIENYEQQIFLGKLHNVFFHKSSHESTKTANIERVNLPSICPTSDTIWTRFLLRLPPGHDSPTCRLNEYLGCFEIGCVRTKKW